MRITSQFSLDTAALKATMSRAKQTAFRRTGAYTRTVARNSIRVRKKRLTKEQRDARVGQAPTSRTRRFKDSVQFDYDSALDAIIVGPTGEHSDPSPAAFEEGGDYPIEIITPAGRRRGLGRYRKFPTMGPALQNSKSKYAEFWANTFH